MKTDLQVLLVEDSEDDARLILRELARGGYTVTAERVETAGDFLRALDRGTCELVLSDYALPHFGGGEALRLLRESGRDLPFIFVSGTMGEDVAVAAMKAGAHDYVMKGNLARLVPAITRELGDAVERRQRRAAETQMRMSEHKYRHLFRSMSDAALLIAEENDRIIDANEQAEVLFGQSRDQILGQSSSLLFPPLEAGLSREAPRQAVPFGPGSRETVAQRKDGTLVPVQVSITHILLDEHPFLLALFRDISALKETVRQLRALVENSPDIILRFDRNGRYVFVNHAMEKVTGIPAAEFIGRPIGEIAALRKGPAVAEKFRQLGQSVGRVFASGATSEEEMRLPMAAGELIFNVRLIPETDEGGPVVSVLTIAREITARQRAEEALHSSEQRFRQVTENIGEVFWLTDTAKNEMIYISPAYERVWGRTCESLYAAPRSWIDAVHPDDRARVRSAALALQSAGGYDLEYRITRPNGNVRWIHDRAFPIKDQEGHVYRIAGVAEDITAKHALEDQLRQAQKMESLGTLAGGIAHDFNNILTGVLGSAEVARLELPANHPVTPWIHNITLAGNRARDLVQQILTFGRKHESEMLPRKLQPVLAEALNLLRSTIPTMVHIESRIDEACPPVIVDDTQIHQVVMNLCTNAWHALPEHGGRIEVGLAPIQVTPAQAGQRLGLTPGPHVLLTVRDNGRGMEPGVLARIFEPFFTTKKQGQGTGLGLAVVHGIVQSHHGAIFAQSTPGQGTLFEVFLPALVNPEGLLQPATAEPALPKGHGEVILLVDDDSVALLGLRGLLEHLGYKVTAVADSRMALELFFSQPGSFHLILTDYALPDISGHDLAAKVLAARPDFPVIITSGLIDAKQVQRARDLGVRDFVRKPVALPELARLIARHLQRP